MAEALPCDRLTPVDSMDILYLLIPLSVVLACGITVVLWWAVRSGQFDDLEGPAHHILMDEDVARK